MLRLGGDTHLPQLLIQLMHELRHPGLDGPVIVVVQLLALGGLGAEQSTAAQHQILPAAVHLLIDEEVFLLGAHLCGDVLGLGVAAGTAYAAVKVAQKYNEKKNANADLNGDGAVDANDTVYGVKEAAREVYAETAAKVREKAPEVREKAAAAIGAVQEKAPEFIEKVKGAAGEAWSAIHGENFPAAEVELEEEPTCSEDVTAEETEEPAAEPETPAAGQE